jgi:hypothetical protein
MDFKLLYQRNRFSEIRLTGSINNVLTASISEANSVGLTPQKVGYSLGLAAIGPSFKSCRERMGEFCTTPGYMGLLPSGENNLAEVVQGMTKTFYTAFNVAIGTDFEEIYSFDFGDEVTFTLFYDKLFEMARGKENYKGLLATSLVFQIEAFYGSLIYNSPISGKLASNKINDNDQFPNWFRVDTQPVYQGKLAVSVGVGFDSESKSFPPEKVNSIFYYHPANVGSGTKILLHNHCFVLEAGKIPVKIGDYNSLIGGMLQNHSILDVKHILDKSTLKRGLVALNYIQDINSKF